MENNKKVTEQELISLLKEKHDALRQFHYPTEFNSNSKNALRRIEEAEDHIRACEEAIWPLMENNELGMWVKNFLCVAFLKKKKVRKFRKLCGYPKRSWKKGVYISQEK